jgi:hypothetical protein
MMTMSDVKLGTLPGAELGRDAVHVAIVPLLAGTHVKPGDHVGWDETEHSGVTRMVSHWATEKFGVVDPFLVLPKGDSIKPGTRVWVCLYPSTISALRHVWSHPAFEDEPTLTHKTAALLRLTDLAQTVGRDYESFLLDLEETDVFYGEECYHIYQHEDQIKQDFYTITGRQLAGLPQFRCSC